MLSFVALLCLVNAIHFNLVFVYLSVAGLSITHRYRSIVHFSFFSVGPVPNLFFLLEFTFVCFFLAVR